MAKNEKPTSPKYDILGNMVEDAERANFKKSKHTVRSDRWDRQDYTRQRKDLPEFDEAGNKLGDFVETGNHAYGDSFFGLVKAVNELLPPDDVMPQYLVNHAILDEAFDINEYERLRNFTIGDPVAAALADITFEPTLEKLFDKHKEEQKLADQLQGISDQLENLERSLEEMEAQMGEGEGDGQGQEAQNMQGRGPVDYQKIYEDTKKTKDQLEKEFEQKKQELQDALKGKKGIRQQMLKKASQEALDQAEQVEAAGLMWGQEPGAIHRLDARTRLEFAKKVSTPKFRRIAQLIGPMTRLAFAEQARKTIYGREEIYDIEIGGDLSRILTSEMIAMDDELLELDFLARLLDNRLLQYKIRGQEKVARGGIIFACDESGSMSGDREIWAKAVGLALLHIAKLQKRPFYWIHFGSAGEMMVHDFRDTQNIKPEAVVECAAFFFGGGPLRIDQRVVTADGWKPIGAVEVGDKLFGSDGRATNVTGVYPQGILEKMYRVRFKDGAEVICDDSHLWTVVDRGPSGQNASQGCRKTLRLKEILEEGVRCKFNGFRFSVPITQPIETPPVDVPIDPYLMGYLLGNGGFTNSSPSVTPTPGDEHPWADKLSGVQPVQVEKRPDFAPSFLLTAGTRGNSSHNPLTEALRTLGLWGHSALDKFIPVAYLRGSIQQRWELLQGLCDADGSYDSPGRVEYGTISENLALNVIELVQSLGGIATHTIVPPRRSNERTFHKIYIILNGDQVPFRLARKVAAWMPRHHDWIRSIVSIEPVEAAECVCIKVDREDGLFLSEGFVVTHNTDFMTPLTHALGLLQEEFDKFGAVKGDIVFATDGQCGVEPVWLEKWEEERRRIAFKSWGIVIGGHPLDQPLNQICDGKVAAVRDLSSGNDVRDIFRL